jgi:hypothetical protein
MSKIFKALVVLFLIAAILLLPATPAAGKARNMRIVERLTVPFESGHIGVQTVHSFSGQVLVKVSGIGQASGTQWSDAFYVFTDYDGNPMEPWHPEEWFNFTLWINGGPVDAFLEEIPPYNPRHIYVFQIKVPAGPLTFAVGDAYTIDNSGQYKLVVRGLTK